MGCAILYQTKQSNINSNMLEILDKLAKLCSAKLIYWQIHQTLVPSLFVVNDITQNNFCGVVMMINHNLSSI